jgi:subfamily B ATP-binding cassette protein MsbA
LSLRGAYISPSKCCHVYDRSVGSICVLCSDCRLDRRDYDRGRWSPDRGLDDTGDFFMYIVFTGLPAMPLVEIASIGTQITEVRVSTGLRDRAWRQSRRIAIAPLNRVHGDVIRRCLVEYQENVPVLKGISFESPAGTTTALVGSAGRQEHVDQPRQGFNRPSQGRVLIDGLTF